MSHIETQLSKIADELDAATGEVGVLYAKRLALWQKASAMGMPSVALARASRVESVTVRSILHRNRLDHGA